jgi:hypothetical protein
MHVFEISRAGGQAGRRAGAQRSRVHQISTTFRRELIASLVLLQRHSTSVQRCGAGVAGRPPASRAPRM